LTEVKRRQFKVSIFQNSLTFDLNVFKLAAINGPPKSAQNKKYEDYGQWD
jgi:hypothetical protein